MQVARPQRLLYIALDGVAPRAKMNNQRERRYKFVDEVRVFKEKAVHTGQEVSSTYFDPNSISPGTDFMLALNERLHEFIVTKLQTDSNWQKLEIVYSGVDVPGEGEHKMMQYMRERQDEPGRHCLYGLDADLIMLGLVTHRQEVIILREEVNITYIHEDPPRKLIGIPPKYQLIYLNLVREYLELDFKGVPGLEIERLIDDFVLIVAFVGNDFIPRLPTFEISEGSIDFLIETYKKRWAEVGYLSLDGVIQWPALASFLSCLPHYELTALESRVSSKKRVRTNEPIPSTRTQTLSVKSLYFEGVNETYTRTKKKKSKEEVEVEEIKEEETVDREGQETLKSTLKAGGIQLIKTRYYQEYFGFDVTQEPGQFQVRDVIREYLRGLQWVLFYYYRGCPDWEWFYRYHYAPMISDFQEVREIIAVPEGGEMHFTSNSPYTPLNQLLSVLPPGSGALLPSSYRSILTNPDHQSMFPERPKIEYDFLCARIGWQSLKIILPFIKLQKVLELTADLQPNDDILRRNALSDEISYKFNHFEEQKIDKIHLPPPKIANFTANQRNFPINPDFPTLKRIQFTPILKEIGVQIFLARSSFATLALELPSKSAHFHDFSS